MFYFIYLFNFALLYIYIYNLGYLSVSLRHMYSKKANKIYLEGKWDHPGCIRLEKRDSTFGLDHSGCIHMEGRDSTLGRE